MYDDCDGERMKYMQQIMRIGDQFIPADDDMKDVGEAGTAITDIARKYKTDVLAVIGKGDKHNLVTQHHEGDTELWQDLAKTIALIQSTADAYSVEATDIVDAIKFIIEKGE